MVLDVSVVGDGKTWKEWEFIESLVVQDLIYKIGNQWDNQYSPKHGRILMYSDESM